MVSLNLCTQFSYLLFTACGAVGRGNDFGLVLTHSVWIGHVCQIRVMTEFETKTLTQDGAVDFKTIAGHARHFSIKLQRR